MTLNTLCISGLYKSGEEAVKSVLGESSGTKKTDRIFITASNGNCYGVAVIVDRPAWEREGSSLLSRLLQIFSEIRRFFISINPNFFKQTVSETLPTENGSKKEKQYDVWINKESFKIRLAQHQDSSSILAQIMPELTPVLIKEHKSLDANPPSVIKHGEYLSEEEILPSLKKMAKEHSDAWTFGCKAFELLTGEPLISYEEYKKYCPGQSESDIKDGYKKDIEWAIIFHGRDHKYIPLLQGLLSVDPKARWSMDQFNAKFLEAFPELTSFPSRSDEVLASIKSTIQKFSPRVACHKSEGTVGYAEVH